MTILQKEPKSQFIGKGEVKGFEFTLLFANSRAFMYKVSNGGLTYYEVFLRKIHSKFGHVMYPRSKAFGLWAWSIFNFNKAKQKFESL